MGQTHSQPERASALVPTSSGHRDSFTFFPRLPPELRLMIWTLALDEWCVVLPGPLIGRETQGLGSGQLPSAIGQVNREARAIMVEKYTNLGDVPIERTSDLIDIPRGWLNFERTVFYLPCVFHDDGFEDRYQIWKNLEHVQHLIVHHGRCSVDCTDKVGSFLLFVADHCYFLRTLTILCSTECPAAQQDHSSRDYYDDLKVLRLGPLIRAIQDERESSNLQDSLLHDYLWVFRLDHPDEMLRPYLDVYVWDVEELKRGKTESPMQELPIIWQLDHIKAQLVEILATLIQRRLLEAMRAIEGGYEAATG